MKNINDPMTAKKSAESPINISNNNTSSNTNNVNVNFQLEPPVNDRIDSPVKKRKSNSSTEKTGKKNEAGNKTGAVFIVVILLVLLALWGISSYSSPEQTNPGKTPGVNGTAQ